MSGSHLAIASFRMEPQYMIMGPLVGVAAALAAKCKKAEQQIDVYALQKKLKAAGRFSP